MKIEDIHYSLPNDEIDDNNFDRDQWLRDNPIDYYKFLYIVLASAENNLNVPKNYAMASVFDVLYMISRLYIPNILYKFYSFTHDENLNKQKLQTLKNKKIFMSDIKDFNDPFDGKAFYYNPKELSGIKRLARHNGTFIDDFTVFHKCTALTENNMNCMPMWAHYSNNHQGFCVAYDMHDSFNTEMSGCTFPVQYTDQRLDITSFMKKYAEMLETQVDDQIAEGKKRIQISDLSIVYITQLLSNIKQATWQYEREFRCTMGTQSNGMPYVNASPQSIYIGMNCNEQNRNELISIARNLSVPIYQMNFDELSDDYTLKEKLI